MSSSLHTQIKYTEILGSQLSQFKKKGKYLWNFRCPYCGDSKKSKTKARGYVYERKRNLFYTCKNCGVGTDLRNLLKHVDPSLEKDFVFEKFKDNEETRSSKNTTVYTRSKDEVSERFHEVCVCIQNANTPIEIKDYIKNRQIPEKHWSDIFWVQKASYLEKIDKKYKDRIKDQHPRIVVPYRDSKGNIFALSARSIKDHPIRYISMIFDDSFPMIWGLDKIDRKKKILVFEGFFDAMFFPNSVAVSGADFGKIKEIIPMDKCIIIPDNQPRNAETRQLLEKVIVLGYAVCIWHTQTPGKDINKMIQNGWTIKKIAGIIRQNIYSGLEAQYELKRWK